MRYIEELKTKKLSGDIYFHQTESENYEFENLELKTFEQKNSQGIGLRVINDKNQEGFVSSHTQEDSQLIDKALHLASLGEVIQYEFPKPFQTSTLPLYDETFDSVKESQILTLGLDVLSQMQQSYSDYQFSFSYGREKSTTQLMNTQGFDQSYEESAYYCSLSALKGQDDQILHLGESLVSRHFISDLQLLKEALQLNLERLKNPVCQIVTGNYSIVLDPKAVASLMNILLIGFDGKKIVENTSPLIDQWGKAIASPLLNVYSDGLSPDLLATSPFDDEGIPSSCLPLISKGICLQGVYDLKTASLAQKESTGNASRSFSSLPTPSFRNIIVDEGTESYEDLLKSLKKGIFIQNFIGSGMSNVLAGEFSANIGLGFFVENGEVKGQIKNTMMNGNIFEIMQHIEAISKERVKSSFSLLPYMLIQNAHIIS